MVGADPQPKGGRIVVGPEMPHCGPIRAIDFEALRRRRPGFSIPNEASRYFNVWPGDLVLAVFTSRNCPAEALWFRVESRRVPTFLGVPVKRRISFVASLYEPRRPFVYARFKKGSRFVFTPRNFGDVLLRPFPLSPNLEARRVDIEKRVNRALRGGEVGSSLGAIPHSPSWPGEKMGFPKATWRKDDCGILKMADAEEWAEYFPSLRIPPRPDRYYALQVGDAVQVLLWSSFCPPEALWLYITSRTKPTFLGVPVPFRFTYIGRIDTEPKVYGSLFRRGESFVFQPSNIFDLHYETIPTAPVFSPLHRYPSEPISEKEKKRRNKYLVMEITRLIPHLLHKPPAEMIRWWWEYVTAPHVW